jgi:hypothetical protein
VVSHNSDLSDPNIDDTTVAANFSPTGLSYRKTCYWQVYAIDPYANSGNGSDIWSFRSPDNVSPFAQITCPATGTIYVEGDTIMFTGSGTDINDGDLGDESLVWSSDLDGRICIGKTCSSNLLGAGIHQISLTATDSADVSWTATVTITVNAGPAAGSLPDTGQVTSHTETFGEDSDYIINPPAYTKLDASGKVLDACATEWAMVRDNVTGLIWEVKTDDGSIHDKDDKYDWEKDQAGDLDAYIDFIDKLNSGEFGGYNDWRLPTVKELTLLVNRDNSPTINTAYFPNTEPSLYWSSTTNAGNINRAWGVHFLYGYSYGAGEPNDKSTSYHVCATRGEKVANDFEDNEKDMVVIDWSTKLMWQKLEVTDDDGEVRAMTWEEALKYCETLDLAGYDDWRLPNVNELQSIVDHEKTGPAIDTTFFEHTPDAIYWSSTTYDLDPQYAWCVRFQGDGHVYQFDKSNSHHDKGATVMCVRAVRSVQ